jgi:polyhydroxyalkanoate synthesis regulator phasin
MGELVTPLLDQRKGKTMKRRNKELIENILLEAEVLELERIKALELEVAQLRKKVAQLEADHASYWAWRERDVAGDLGIFR